VKTESGARLVMTTSEIVARISDLKPKFMEGLAPGDLRAILAEATVRQFRPRSVIASEGYPADKLFLIVEGLARTFTTTRSGEKILVFWILPGEICGGRALLSKPTEYLVSTETVTDSFALIWNHSAILSFAKRYPKLLENALLIASDYMAVYRDLHVAATYDSASQRVARVLNTLAQGMGQIGYEGTVLNISNEELANEANVTIFTVSRLLSDWHRKGFVVKSRGKVVIRSSEQLVRSVR
jgi:CRP/FNR family transcriptional regulator, nitrogen oxide reductase regulator